MNFIFFLPIKGRSDEESPKVPRKKKILKEGISMLPSLHNFLQSLLCINNKSINKDQKKKKEN